jgi:hypothetical protein
MPLVLIQCVLQCLAGAKFRNLGCLDFDRAAGAWVAPGARCALGNRKRSEADDRNAAILFQGGANTTNQGLQRAPCRCFGDISLCGDVLNQFRLVHVGPLFFWEGFAEFEDLESQAAANSDPTTGPPPNEQTEDCTPVREPLWRSAQLRACVGRITKATPAAHANMPNRIKRVRASSNSSHASKAVQGGTRYIKLLTFVAAPR